MEAVAEKRPRRKPQVRSARTRERLLAAAVDCLRERGYAGVTVAEIAERAGVSRGAQIHHFPTKADLITAAVAHYYTLRARRIADRVRANANPADPVGAAIDALWAVTRDPAEVVAPDLEIAARTDTELRTKLVPYLAAQPRFAAKIGREVLGDLAVRSPMFDEILQVVLHALGGLATRAEIQPDPAFEADQIEAIKTMVRAALGSPAAGKD